MNALVIDDARAIRMVLRNIMTAMGYEVTEAADGSEALARLEEMDGIDVMLVDWNMPVMNGIDFVRTVRADERYEGAAIVMVTTEAEMSNIVEALGAGANEYVMKPFTKEAIEEKLELLGLIPQ